MYMMKARMRIRFLIANHSLERFSVAYRHEPSFMDPPGRCRSSKQSISASQSNQRNHCAAPQLRVTSQCRLQFNSHILRKPSNSPILVTAQYKLHSEQLAQMDAIAACPLYLSTSIQWRHASSQQRPLKGMCIV